MKIAFFNITPFEKKFFKENLDENVEAYYLPFSLNEDTEIDDVEVDAVSVSVHSKLNSQSLSKFKNLKFIFARSVGYNHIDLEWAKHAGILVFNTPNYGNDTIAEFTFGLLLCLVRKINIAAFDLAQEKLSSNYKGIELNGKTLGIIGLGAIGRKVERIAKCFSMDTICYDILPHNGYNMVSFDELLENSDIISLHTPLTKDNYHLIGESEFSLMKEGVIIINTARGELINTDALLDNLNSGKIGGACLDVVECEKLINENDDDICIDCIDDICLRKYMVNRKLLSKENVIITPHIAYSTKEAVDRILKITLDNINSVDGENLKNLVK